MEKETAAIFYYSGTGNSLWLARLAAEALGGADLVPIAGRSPGPVRVDAAAVGMAFPVHIWGVPAAVRRFVRDLRGARPRYLFALAANAGQVAGTLLQVEAELRENGQDLAAGFAFTLPSNYIPWGGPGPKEERERRFEAARKKMFAVAGIVRAGKRVPVERGPLWQRIVFTPVYRMSFPKVPVMDRKFWADEKCDGCPVCARVCPVRNIVMAEGRPVWQGRCEQCFACLQWCPREAVQYGRKTPRYERYHHPEVSLKDILVSR